MYDEKPRLLYEVSVERGRLRGRFFRLALLVLLVAGAYWALSEAARRGLVEALVLDVGQLVAVALGGLLAVRALYHLLLWIVRRSESVRVFDKGFVWTRGKTQAKHSWGQLATYREGARGVYLFGKMPLLQWGAHRLTLRDGTVYKFNGRFGDTRLFASAVRKPAAEATGARIGQILRSDRPVRVHSHLTLYYGGVESGKTEIPWDALDIRLKRGQLVIRQKNPATNQWRVVRRYPQHTVDNVGGVLDITTEMIRLNQPERFRG